LESRLESVVCPGCACLCDDIDVTVAAGRLYQAANICLWGASKLLGHKRFHAHKERRRLTHPQLRQRGRWETVSYETAVARTAEILTQARRPVIYGLTNTGCGAQAMALELARRARARLEPADLAWKGPYYQILKEFGVVLTTLEVIRDEADTLVFWGANPFHSCPRHLVRYSFFARGRFTDRGHEERRLAVVDIHPTELAELAQVFLKVRPGEELALLQDLLSDLEGRAPASSKGVRRLAALLREAAFGVIFFGRGVSYGPTPQILEGLAALTARLNEQSRFVLFPLSTDFNAAGLSQILLRELGSPLAPDFAESPEVTFYAEPVAWDQVDAILVVGADLFWFLSPQEMQGLQSRRVPVVALSPMANRTTGHAQVILPVALAGVETAEVAYRMDGLPLQLSALVPSALPSDEEVLEAVATAVDKRVGGR